MIHNIKKNTYTMRSYTIKHLINTNRFNLFRVRGSFNKNLGVQIVVIAWYIFVSLSQ